MHKSISAKNRRGMSMYTVVGFYIIDGIGWYHLTADFDGLKMHTVRLVYVCVNNWENPILFSTVVAPVRIPTKSTIGVPSPHPSQHLFFVNLFMMAFLTGMKSHLIVTLICTSLMVSHVELLFTCLRAVCMSSLEKCLFGLLPVF